MDESQLGSRVDARDLDGGFGQVGEQLAYVGQRIRALRRERGYSQEGFALRIGLARSYYGALERGERNFSVALLLRIVGGLEVEASALLPPLSRFISAIFEKEQFEEQVAEGERVQGKTDQEGQAPNRASYISAGVAAHILGVNRRTIARWVADGTMEAIFVEDSNGKLIAVFRRDAVKKISETPSAAKRP